VRFLAALSVVLSLAAVQPAVQPPSATRTIRRHYDPADRETGRYQYVPIEVAAGTEALTISYRYSGDDGSSVVDIGLFEPGPLDLGTSSFRGYSGGSQRTVTVGRTSSSAAYRSGPLPSGQWHVMLGLYKVAPGGVDVDIDVTESREEAKTAARAPAPVSPAISPARRADAAATRTPRWFSGGLHLHTTHSDGSISPGALADAARAAGLEFIAITDHNNTTHTREPLPPSPLHIVGEEVTTPAGHANVWGLPANAWIDFRVRPTDPGAAAAINRLVAVAHKAGGIVAINHPVTDCAGCSWEQVIPDALDAIEIWNGEKGPQDAAIAIWDRLLRAGRHVTAIGASDWHRVPARIEAAAVRVLAADLTQPAILDAIRRGHVIVMRDAKSAAPSIRVNCGAREAAIGDTLACAAGDTLHVRVSSVGVPGARAAFVWNGERRESRTIGDEVTFEMPASAGYARVHVYAADGGAVAITNPVYVTAR
jgi:hypothetical protein